MVAMVSSDFFVDDIVVALAGVREDQTGEVVRSRLRQLLPMPRRRVRAELRGEAVRVRWAGDQLATWYPAALLAHSRAVLDRARPG